jgi:Flp pilus assembly protein TadG
MAAVTLRRFRRRGGDERGAELIELAIVLPILLVVFAAIVDFGFLFQRYEVITNAAREGARIGVLPDYTQADVTDRVRAYLNSSGLNGASANVSVAYSTQTLSSGETVPVVNVIVGYFSNYAVLGPIAGMVGGSGWTSINLRSGSMMRLEPGAGS